MKKTGQSSSSTSCTVFSRADWCDQSEKYTEREASLESARQRMRDVRAAETPEEKEACLQQMRQRKQQKTASETPEERGPLAANEPKEATENS